MPRTHAITIAKRQSGAVLVVSLLLLLVMTALALSASQATRMQERMAASARNHDLAFQAAEAGLRAGERLVKDLVFAPYPCSTVPCNIYELGYLTQTMSYQDQAYQRYADWWESRAQTYLGVAEIGGAPGLPSIEPHFYVEELEDVPDTLTIPPTGPPPSRTYYRVTAQGQGGTDAAQVVLQTTYARRFN